MKKPENVYVDNAGKKGRGVFAQKEIKEGSVIEISPFIEVPAPDYKALGKTILNSYWYEVDNKTCGIGLGYTSLYNHAKRPNCEFHVCKESKTITIKAIRKIDKGEELLINYGYDVRMFLKKSK